MEKSDLRRLGPALCWAVVFADIGTSVYYVPGILFGQVGATAPTFVLLTSFAFVLLAIKYSEISERYEDGGGVVAVASDAFGPYLGCLGGVLITIDYFLTVAISAVSGFHYLDAIVPLGFWLLPAVVFALSVLGLLNWVGIKESARTSAIMAASAFIVDLLVLGVTAAQLDQGQWRLVLDRLLALRGLSLTQGLVGFGSAWLAFSGLESLSQLSPAMASPRNKVAPRAMLLVVVSILLTAPLLTAFSTALLQARLVNPDRFVSELGFAYGGIALKVGVIFTAGALLLFAANTAIIGAYHVFVALSRHGFMPARVAAINRKFGTPHTAIGIAVIIPVAIVLVVRGNMRTLGEMYAFGLLGAFCLSSMGLDRVRWLEHKRGPSMWIGVATSAMVFVAWATNLVTKELATAFGVTATAIGMGVAVGTRRGWFDSLIGALPYVTAEEAESMAEQLPSAARIVTLPEAVALKNLYQPSTLVAVRGANPTLIREAVLRVRGRKKPLVAVLYVDEIPGPFYPSLIGPSEEAREVLGEMVRAFEREEIEVIPIWRMGHDAGTSIAGAAIDLGVEAVMVGTSHRSALWHLVRGDVLSKLLHRLPESIRLIICN
jgi:amino acid transporter/nucleotide-binding universal stress UspA family protein